jgi:hypothetical protein
MAITGAAQADQLPAGSPGESRSQESHSQIPGPDRPRRVTILGSTGSIGQSTVDLLLRNRDAFTVEALTAHHNTALLAEQAKALDARFAAVADPADYPALKEALSGTGIEVACGRAALVEAAVRPADWMMAGIVGAAGLEPTLAAVRQGRIVAFANKEVLVCAGSPIGALAQCVSGVPARIRERRQQSIVPSGLPPDLGSSRCRAGWRARRRESARSADTRWTIDPRDADRLLGGRYRRRRLAYRDVASPTNRLTLISAVLPAGCVSTGH